MDYTLTATSKNDDLKTTTIIEAPTTKEDYDYTWDYLTLGANNSTTYGTGISLTYRYKSNFSWKVFFDYDYTKKDFELRYDPLNYMRSALTNSSYILAQNIESIYPYLDAQEYHKTKKMNYYTIGMSFMVNL
jgi:hypothetical protein